MEMSLFYAIIFLGCIYFILDDFAGKRTITGLALKVRDSL